MKDTPPNKGYGMQMEIFTLCEACAKKSSLSDNKLSKKHEMICLGASNDSLSVSDISGDLSSYFGSDGKVS